MDAQSRGRADDIDPADQWVLNPQTGHYELRLDHSAGKSTATADRCASPASPRSSPRRRAAEVPGQRRRRTPATVTGPDGPGGPAGGTRRTKDGNGTPAASGRRKRKPKKERKKKALLWTGGVTAFAVVAVGTTGYALYQHLNGNLQTYDVGGAGSGGFKKGQAVNILVIGTDRRTGKGNEGYGDKDSPGHADTTILFHVAKDRSNATALSIPRDMITDIPDCPTKQPDGSTKVIPGQTGVRFNTSLGQNGRDPGCTMRTVKEITGLAVDHFMMADFNAVKELTTAIGGVEVCLAKPVKDPDSHLELPAGTSVIEGEQALAFVRTRHSFGNQSDLDRIKTQQQFLSSMLRKMKSEDTLTNPAKLYGLADSATKALAVDSGIGSIKKLTELAQELSGIEPKNITFATVPVVDNPAEQVKSTVVLDRAKAGPLFAMLQNDVSLTEVRKKEQEEAKDAKAARDALLKGPRAKAGDVRVDVYNGSGRQGAAQSTIGWLQNDMGVGRSANRSNAPSVIARTTLEFAPDQADQARALADMMGLPATALKQTAGPAGEYEAMTLTLGEDFKGAGVPLTGPAKAPEGVQKVEADKQICAK